ncbi:hypothetical protein GF324_06250 [bacterium]|nr:hypothetical protein [bacterium]
MYNPAGSEYATEYVELLNPDDQSVDLNGWLISDGTAADTLVPLIPEGGLTLPAGGYALILDPDYLADGEGLYDAQIPPDALLLTVPDAAIASGGLSNSTAEMVSLLAPDGSVVSARTYLLGAGQGISEERVRPDDGDDDDNWRFSTPGGTPGYRNSVTPPPVDEGVEIVRLQVVQDTDSLSSSGLAWELAVFNRGDQASGGNRLQIGLSEDDSWETYDVPSLAFGDSVVFTETVTGIVLGGSYTFIARLDRGDDNPSNDADTASVLLPFLPGSVQVSEIMADPPDERPVEWVELYARNRDFSDIDLQDWTLVDAAGTEGRIAAPLLPVHGSYLVLSADSLPVLEGELPIPRAPATSPPNLNNAGDSLLLLDPTGRLIDAVVYHDAPTGHSMYRTRWSAPPLPYDWLPTIGPSSSTPGRAPVSGLADDSAGVEARGTVTVEPNPIHPVEGTVFHFEFPADQVSVTLRLFDVNGRELGTLLDSRPFPGRSRFLWDGRTGVRRALPAGVYVWLLHADADNGEGSWKRKGTVVSPGL